MKVKFQFNNQFIPFYLILRIKLNKFDNEQMIFFFLEGFDFYLTSALLNHAVIYRARSRARVSIIYLLHLVR